MKKCVRFEGARIQVGQTEVYFEGKIKNTDELAGIFLTRNPADLAVAAYQRWGHNCVQHLSGTFALVVIDPVAQRIFCARDPSGTHPLYYCFEPNHFFAFGTRIQDVLSFENVPKHIDNQTIGRYLRGAQDYSPYAPDSFYEAVKRIEPGYGISFSADTIANKTAWPMPLYPEISTQTELSESDWVARFAELFNESVSFQTDHCQRIGSHLSGGLDSSSVSAVAQLKNLKPIKTVQVHTGLETIDERPFAEAVARNSGTSHHVVQPSDQVWQQLTATTALLGYPHQLALPPCFHWAASAKAAELGCDVLLTGHDGDTVVGYGNGHVQTILEQRQWDNLALAMAQLARKRDLSNLVKNWDSLSETEKISAFEVAFWGNEIKKSLQNRAFFSTLNHLFSASLRFGVYPWQVFEWWRKRRPPATSAPRTEAVHFAIDKREIKENPATKATHYQQIYCGRMLDVTEQLTHVGRHFGHQYAHPFYDRELVALCLATPEKLRFDHGSGRGPLRRAMRGVLPEITRLRTQKSYFNAYNQQVSQLMATDALGIFGKNHPLWQHADRDRFARSCQNFSDQPPALLHFNAVLQLGIWLDTRQ